MQVGASTALVCPLDRQAHQAGRQAAGGSTLACLCVLVLSTHPPHPTHQLLSALKRRVTSALFAASRCAASRSWSCSDCTCRCSAAVRRSASAWAMPSWVRTVSSSAVSLGRQRDTHWSRCNAIRDLWNSVESAGGLAGVDWTVGIAGCNDGGRKQMSGSLKVAMCEGGVGGGARQNTRTVRWQLTSCSVSPSAMQSLRRQLSGRAVRVHATWETM